MLFFGIKVVFEPTDKMLNVENRTHPTVTFSFENCDFNRTRTDCFCGCFETGGLIKRHESVSVAVIDEDRSEVGFHVEDG